MKTDDPAGAEQSRLAESQEARSPWRQWGPYLSARQWGTVREDYSADGNAWAYLPFEQAHARAYRWGDDGLGGLSDDLGFLNLSFALWNGADPILKERLFGLTNVEGNHGEDAKEYWWALDGTPTHSWMQWLYRYPQAAFPYERLRQENARRTRADREFELADTGVFDDNRFFDVTVTYAKNAPDDICMELTATNHGPDARPLHLLPQIWFRNTWSWGRDERRPSLTSLARSADDGPDPGGVTDVTALVCQHAYLGRYVLTAESAAGAAGPPELLFCANETNAAALFGSTSAAATGGTDLFTKDGINNRVVHGDTGATHSDGSGTKAAFWYRFDSVGAGQTVRVRLRLSPHDPGRHTFGADFDQILAERRREADGFYAAVLPAALDDGDRGVARRAFAGLLWNKKHYRYTVRDWLAGDPGQPTPPADREWPGARNRTWGHLALADVISMPDEWEYPWFAAWDLAFHCVTFAHVDPHFAKNQLVLLCREWAMHPNGQLPAYEWSFGDLNPPVHAWATWQVYLIDGRRDHEFLVRMFTKLLLNFSSWVNKEDADGSNLFEGGFLGMDNIGLFDRSAPLTGGNRLEESDATSWMAFYCLTMLQMAWELARVDRVWDDLATKFLEHFLAIAAAVAAFGTQDVGLWDDADGFCYDVLVRPDGTGEPLRVRSMVGLLPVLAVAVGSEWVATELPDFTGRLAWLREHRPELTGPLIATTDGRTLLSLLEPARLQRVLHRMLDESEFLSPYGLRSLSAAYRDPLTTRIDGREFSIDYEPGESRTGLFGGNSNWRGPVWMPVNVLLSAALRVYGTHDPAATVELPTGSGRHLTYAQAADELDRRLTSLFRVGPSGRRPSDGSRIESSADPLWRDQLTFNEYFDGDTGEGLGASHQTGWTALVAHLLCRREIPPVP